MRAREERAGWIAVALAVVASCGGVTNTGRTGVGDGVDSGAGGGASPGGASSTGGIIGGRSGAPSSGGGAFAAEAGVREADAAASDGSVATPADASVDSRAANDAADGAALIESARALVGSYDVWLEPPKVPNCQLATKSRLNLIVTIKDGALVAYLFEDEHWSFEASTAVTLEPGLLVLDPVSLFSDPPPDARPRLRLGFGPSGFDPSGLAGAHLSCDDGSTMKAAVVARVEPDHTPPRLIADPYADMGRVFPFTYVSFHLTEPARIDSIEAFYPDPEDIDVRSQVTLVNVATDLPIPIDYAGFPWMGPQTDVVFQDPESVVGVTFRATPVNLTDLAGNAAIADDHTYTVSSGGPVVSRVDFDDGPHPSTYGPATYFAPGTTGAPCESGGCLVMEGQIQSCDLTTPVDAPALVTRFAFTPDQTWATLRYRVWTTNPNLLSLQVLSDVGCGEGTYVDLQPLATSEGQYSYASAWQDAKVGPCLGPDGKNPIIVTVPCIYNGGGLPSEPARFVVESITLNPAPTVRADGGVP